jgi:hypothetical protein
MLRTFGKWMISRASERETPLPGWLRRWADHDQELARFAAASRRLGPLLRRDAAEWLDVQTEEVRPARRSHARASGAEQRPVQLPVGLVRRRFAGAWAAGGVAAALVLAALAWRMPTSEDSSVAPVPRGGQAATISPQEREQLILAWRAGRANLGAWQARVKGVSRRIGAYELRRATLKFPRVEIADAATERVLTALDAAAAAQRRELADGVKSAYGFFAERLPASVAALVGWQEG